MVMKLPERHRERIATLPLVANTVDHRGPGAAEHVIHGGTRVAVRASDFAAAKHLDAAGHRRQRWAAVERIDVFQKDTVVRVTGTLAENFQRRFCIRPAIAIPRRMNGITL